MNRSSADMARSDGLITVASRNLEPTPSSPLTYRERAYFLSPPADPVRLEVLLQAELAGLRRELAGRPRGQFVNLAVFDQMFQGAPTHAPIATLEWKDWRGPPIFALGSPHGLTQASGASAAAPGGRTPASEGPLAGKEPPRGLAEGDNRLATAFEAMPDLYFLSTPVAGLEFVIQLLIRLTPCEAISTCLYDASTDEFRFVALTGAGALDRQASAVPSSVGLFGIAKRERQTFMVFHPERDPHYRPEIDGRSGLHMREVAYAPLRYQGVLMGMLQLLNREDARGFTEADGAVVTYIAKQLAEFLAVRKGFAG